ncbi:MAG: tetratricopeptide repeat protein [Saprospiraceae bacterium]
MMKWLRRLFGAKENLQQSNAEYTRFHPGDYIYTTDDEGYHVCRVLKYEPDQGGVHLSMYNVVSQQPNAQTLDQLELFIQHAPLSVGGLKNPVHFASVPLTTADFGGYHTYLEATEQADYIPWHFLERGNALDNVQQYPDAIALYEECLVLYPSFFQAMDNMAFSYMSMGQWEPAIQYFRDSLGIEPDGLHATFSLGEALFKSGDKSSAIPYFEKALVLKPDFEIANDFLEACR